MIKDVIQLTETAGQHERALEWDGACGPEVDRVARYGQPVVPLLVDLLDHGEDWRVDSFICYDQQIQLALCKIFKEQPLIGVNIYGVRVDETDNLKVKKHWERKTKGVQQSLAPYGAQRDADKPIE